VEQIAARLDNQFHLLTGGSRTLHRHQTLRTLIDWSHNLLTEQERALLRRLSVFAGGWTLQAAEAVCSDDARPGVILSHSVMDLLDELVNKSLVVVNRGPPDTRYHILETIRQYAQDKLVESQGRSTSTRAACGLLPLFSAIRRDRSGWKRGSRIF
jgi:predicted ATPase